MQTIDLMEFTLPGPERRFLLETMSLFQVSRSDGMALAESVMNGTDLRLKAISCFTVAMLKQFILNDTVGAINACDLFFRFCPNDSRVFLVKAVKSQGLMNLRRFEEAIIEAQEAVIPATEISVKFGTLAMSTIGVSATHLGLLEMAEKALKAVYSESSQEGVIIACLGYVKAKLHKDPAGKIMMERAFNMLTELPPELKRKYEEISK